MKLRKIIAIGLILIMMTNVKQEWFQVYLNDRDEFEDKQVGTGFAIKVRNECTFEETIGAPPSISL